jgi:acetylornithine deacetylase/succinyl-diaminopimelate desuccinylase-like protein
MDSVFPENMNPIDLDNTKQALSTIESYLRYMRERIEYTITILTKLNSGTALADLASSVAKLQAKHASGSTDPDSSTVGTIGTIYVNTAAGTAFICVDTSPYTWVAI